MIGHIQKMPTIGCMRFSPVKYLALFRLSSLIDGADTFDPREKVVSPIMEFFHKAERGVLSINSKFGIQRGHCCSRGCFMVERMPIRYFPVFLVTVSRRSLIEKWTLSRGGFVNHCVGEIRREGVLALIRMRSHT